MTEQMKMDGGKSGGTVECLGMTFPSDDARREHFQKLLAEKLQDPAFRAQEGFPKGTDDAILAMSDPPYYTACPNPWLADLINSVKVYAKTEEGHTAEPFTADVSEGKNNPIYTALSYHTKVPHKAIMRYILHYTKPGDIVLDGFCGTGMTGIAANLCSDSKEVISLGYRVDDKGNIFRPASDDGKWEKFSRLGSRYSVLADLSPAATFISYNYNSPWNAALLNEKADGILSVVERNHAWMFSTLHRPNEEDISNSITTLRNSRMDITDLNNLNRINYTIWSDVFSCKECGGEIIFWNAAADHDLGKLSDTFYCSECGVSSSKRSVERCWVNEVDIGSGQFHRFAKQVPVEINYTFNGKRFSKKPDLYDLEVIKAVEKISPQYWFPTDQLPEGYNTRQPIESHGFSHVHHFYTRRNLIVLSELYEQAEKSKLPLLKELVVNMMTRANKQSSLHVSNYFNGGGGVCKGHLSGTLYVPSVSPEIPALKLFKDRLDTFDRWLQVAVKKRASVISTQSFSELGLNDASVDYIFLDPPFGKNLMYSELNFIDESWLRITTKNTHEAIENNVQGKGLSEYRQLMSNCFAEAHRVLKPGRWMTVEFSNTKANVWNAIQVALQEVGFVVADVATLDKKQGTFKAVTTTTAVKQDLIISAYKPSNEFEDKFKQEFNTENAAWGFVTSHLTYLPITKVQNGTLDFIAERDPRILFDRMVSWFIRHEVPVPMSTHEFQQGLSKRFYERDGMFFLPEQVDLYDRKRAQFTQRPQMELFVSDERSAIDWLTDFLKKRPSTYQEVNPEFMTQLGAGWKKHEMRPELSALLEDNFLRFDGNGDVPSQIHSYLSTNFKDLRGLEKEDPRLKAKAKDRWFVPDPNKAKDLEQKRERSLLKEFEAYKTATKRQLKESRLEVLRAGFRTAWATKDYKTIIGIAEKLPDETLQEDEKLLLWYDQALTRTEADA